MTSETYQREHLVNVDDPTRQTIETAFLATSPRRMISEALYDSIVVGGRLFDVKHEAGKNLTTAWRHEQIVKEKNKSEEIATSNLASAVNVAKPVMEEKAKPEAVPTSGAYSVEDAFELDFNAVLAKKDDEPKIEDPPLPPADGGSGGTTPTESRPASNNWPDIVAHYFPKGAGTQYNEGGLVRGGGCAAKGRGRGKIV